MTEDSTIFDENCDDTEATASERIFDAYVHGQMCNVAKYGLWWTLLSPLLLSLFNGNFVSIGLSRFCLNVAIIFTTPTASVLLNKVTAKKMLLMSTIGRALIYVVFIPLSWILFQSKIKTFQGLDSNIFFAIAFFILICVDGIFLSFGNVIDIDNGGADIVMTEYDISMESIRKRRYNFIQVMCSDGAMLSLCPITGLLGVLYLEIWNRWILFNYDPQALILLLLMVTVFLFSSLYSLCSYTRMPTIRQRKRMLRNTLESNIALGFDEIFSNSRLFWRVLLLSIESAIEDIVMGILLLVCSLHFTRDGEYVISNMWLQLLISFSKLGAILAVLYWTFPLRGVRRFSLSQETLEVMIRFRSSSRQAWKAARRLDTLKIHELYALSSYRHASPTNHTDIVEKWKSLNRISLISNENASSP